MDKQIIEQGKGAAITAYIMGVGALIAMSMNSEDKNPFASFHVRQGLGLTILFIAIGYTISGFWTPMIAFPFYLFMVVLWGYGFYTAISGQLIPIPLVGSLFQKVFKNL